MLALRRLCWIFLCGFVAVLGAAAALTVVLFAEKHRFKSQTASEIDRMRSSLFYVKNNEAKVSDLSLVPITIGAGFRGKVSNNWDREFHSFRVTVEFKQNGAPIFSSGENVDLSVKPGETKDFTVVFRQVDAKSLTSDIQYEVKILWLKESVL
jgi:hypothetical protein